jgi:hypothetical protein
MFSYWTLPSRFGQLAGVDEPAEFGLGCSDLRKQGDGIRYRQQRLHAAEGARVAIDSNAPCRISRFAPPALEAPSRSRRPQPESQQRRNRRDVAFWRCRIRRMPLVIGFVEAKADSVIRTDR